MSLAELYARVAAAEEEDLLEQCAEEQHEAWLRDLYGPWSDSEPAVPEREEPDADAQHETPPTHSQAIAIVQHLLGAELLGEL